jgi:hypothetical protein
VIRRRENVLDVRCEATKALARERGITFGEPRIELDKLRMWKESILAKLSGVGKDLETFSLETVQMFRDDAVKAGFRL